MAIKGAIQIGELNDEILKIVGKVTNEVRVLIEESAEKSAKFAVRRLKSDSPKLTGDYRKGWRLKRDYSKRKGTVKFIVHNATDYRLTHLLEKGHAKADGTGKVAPQVHIKPVEDASTKMFLDLLEEGVKKLGT